MNYSGNMPDWHQYNPPQSGISDVTPTAQNVNSGHLPFISSINSSCPTQLNNPNLNPDGLEKHQNDLQTFNPRHFQQHLSANMPHGHNVTDNTPLASMVQMQNCIGHYGPSNTRNPVVDNLNGPMDPRNTAMNGLNEELNYRNNQVPLHSNGPMSHLNGPNVMNMNAPHRSIGSRNTNVNPNSHAANRTSLPPSSFPPCKAPCCNQDPNYQQWEKYCSYQNNMAYRENVRTNGYQADARRFGSDFNFRKDNFDSKEILPPPMIPNAPNASDHRRNFSDFKYRKERSVTRNYPSNSGMLQSYPMQNYNYTGDYQKYSYPNIKEYPKMSNMNVPPNQGMIKHQDQNFYQQKYNNKSMPYQNNGTMISNVMPTANHIPNSNMISPTQNSYFNSQYSRNLSTDTSHDCQHADNCQVANDNTTMMNARIQTSNMHTSSHVQYQQAYQQKIAMQRFSMENHLREMTKIPGYQSHPKYKECILRYREILKLQQSVAYHGQIPPQQTSSCVSATTSLNTTVPPINLQFDQNGVLINSNYVPDGFPRIQQMLNSQTSDNPVDKQNKQEDGNASEMMNHNIRKPEQLVSQQHDNQTTVLCLKGMEQQDRYSAQKNLDQSQFEKTGNENFNDLNANTSDASVQQKISKEFADKPELDVRQFLANWDESEDEDGTNTNAVLSDSTSVVVVGYENVNFSTKTLETLEGSKPEEITTNVIAFENPDKSNTGAMPAQDCLTISYASTENVEITKDSTCKEITKENIVQPGTSHIIQCISNGPDEVPTIHIVDNLEIGSILQVTNGQITQTLGRQDAISFFQDNTKIQTSTITIETDKKTDGNNEPATKCNGHLEDLNKEKYIVENSSEMVEEKISQISQKNDNHQEITALSTSVKNNLDSSQDMNLKKQNSFASEESHNPDDISLPDLPTSECTPISTTLNTPIHSDNEESPERSQDLTISTNPIEIIQNSPIISFTQSPKSEPYDHLNNEREVVKNKSMDSLKNQYQTENRFKDQNSDILERDVVLGTFEFSTNIDKNESIVENGKERMNLNGDPSNMDNSRTFLNSEAEKVDATNVCMTLTPGEYELKIMSAQNIEISNKSVRDYNSSIEHRASESQTVAINQDASIADKKLQILPETSTKNTYNNSTQLDEALQNITDKSDEHHDGHQDNIHYEKKCTLTGLNHETTTSANTINLSTNDIASISSKTTVEDNCSRKNVESNSSILLSVKQHPISNSDRLQKYETSDNSEKNSSLEKNANDNKSLKIDTIDLKNSWHIKVTDQKKSILNDQTNPHHSKISPENTTEKCNEMIMQHDKHVQDVAIYKDKSCAMENLNKSNILCKKPRIIDNVSIDDSGERMRFLKEYRRIKHKSSNEEETQTKNKNMLEAYDFSVGKICHFSSDADEQSTLQILTDKQLSQKNVKFKLAEEQEKKHANVLKAFVTKNANPDFAIQVTNVNLKHKDNKEEKESKHLEEETKNSGPLDAIKIEINVSCTERNTTEKLLHENIKNAVVETIGHLTNSISNGARSTHLTEAQCDKRITCDKDDLDYPEKHNQSSSLTEASTYKEPCSKDQSNIEIVKYESLITACKNDMMNETSGSLISRKKSSSSEQELMDNMYKDNGKFLKIIINIIIHYIHYVMIISYYLFMIILIILLNNIILGNININTEMALNSTEILKPEHTMSRRRSMHQNTEKKVTVANFNGSDELKTSIQHNSSCTESTTRNITIEKEYQETTIASVCRNVRNLQDNIASRLSAIPSTSSSTMDLNLEDTNNNNSTHFDYDHFDVAPNENLDVGDKRIDKWKRSKKSDGKLSNLDLYKTASGYMNPIFFSSDELENLNTVPVYTTKDGKITYSPNPRFTYRELIIEARAKDTYSNVCESSYFATSSPFDYYNYSKLHKIFKRNRNIPTTIRKKEIDGKLQSTAKHVNYSLNKSATHKNTYCAKIRNTPHLEFFNNDADKLYVNRNHQQDSKEDKNIVDLNFLEKQYNLDNESVSSTIKRCKTKVFADNFGYEKGYSENSIFDSNLFLGSKIAYWEETMESIKSYSSHIDRRNNDKELNFSEVFAAQKRLELFPFLSAQNSLNSNNNQKTNSNVTNELISNRATCIYNIDNRNQNAENDSSFNQSDAVPLIEQDECNKQNISTTKANDYTSNVADEYPKQESQSNEVQSSMIALTEKVYSSKTTDTGDTKEEQDSTSNIKDQGALTEHLIENDAHVHINKDKDIRNESTKEISDLNFIEITTLAESTTENLRNEPKCTETTEESVSTLNEKNDEIDSAKNNSDLERAMNECQQVSLVPIDCEAKEEAMFVTESIATEAAIDFDKTCEQKDTYNKENSTNKKKKSIISQNLSDDVFMEQLQLNKEDNEQQSQKLDNEEEIPEASSKNQVNNEVDDYNTGITPNPLASLDLLPISMEKNVCNLFTSEKCEQNISEFTVIKSIIADKKERQEFETKNESKDCDNIIDTKLLCMDSSDYGIYAEDRCALTRMSEHDFTEEDSMVPMEWETSQIQEEAVNRLCNIDESSIDFAVAASSLQDNSLLDNLSLSTSLKESEIPQTTVTIENKSNASMSTTELLPEIEVSKITPISEENKEQASSSKHERTSYWRTTDCNANTKMVPKLVIKKSNIDNMVHKSLLKPGSQPKIPKMIIRNARSRPGTPSIESIHEEIPVQISDRISLTSEELYENDSENSLQDSNSYRNKIPKMKIKLDDKYSNKIIKTKDITEFCVRRKNIKKTIPKVKIKNSSIDLSDNSACEITSQGSKKNLEKYEEKIPILKLKKKERNRSSSPEASRKRQGSSYSETSSKKYKKLERDEMVYSTKRSNFSDSIRTVIPESETKKNSLVRISEKIPKVIIKRTSASAEFKCELSKGCKDIIAKSAKWQPAVKLERYQVLDSMVKDLKLTLSSVSLRNINEMFTNRKDANRQQKKDDNRLSKSNSMSNLLPIKCKQRRMSDYDCGKIDYADNFICALSQDLSDSKSTTKKSCRSYQSDNKHRSRSHHKNSQAETDVIPCDKEVNQSLKKSNLEKATSQYDDYKTAIRSFHTNHKQIVKENEDKTALNKLNQKNDSNKHSSHSTNFKIAVKELKTTSKIETCSVKSPDLNEISSVEIDMRSSKKEIKEQHDNSFLSTDSKVIIKKEPPSDFSSDIDNNCNLQNDITLLKDAIVLDDFEFNSNTVIKIESSDESQSTIEILPASPHSPDELESRIIEHRDNEQLYSADAIPTQFELELEITDNSNIDLLDVAMPKLDPVTNYSSRRVSTEESYNNQISKTERHKFELSSHKNLLGKDKRTEVNISSNDKSSPNNDNPISSAREVSLKYTCNEITDSIATKKNFCCNDSLIKEVLAAKETLKKCLSKSRYENDDTKNNLRPKTAAEKKQGLSFDLKNLSKAHSKSTEVLQGCHNDVTSKKISVFITDKHNKIETTTNAEKFNQKHSRENKNCFMKEKLNDKKNKELHPKETMKDTREYTVTSPETFKQVHQATLNKGPIRTICLSEKRKHSMDQDNSILHLQNSQRKELSPYKIPKVSKSTDQESNTSSKTKDIKPDNMPILEPEIAITFDANSDRDSSRSPPVITNQDSGGLDTMESKLVNEKIIISDNKIESDIKDNICKKGEISISDFITQLAYHEKVRKIIFFFIDSMSAISLIFIMFLFCRRQ